MRNAIVLVLLTGGLVGWMAPGLKTIDQPSEVHAAGGNAGDPMIATLDTSDNGWAAGAMTLPREGDGHFYADIEVDMRPYRMLVDTGASVVALTGSDARDMGLHWDPNAVRVIGQGASGDVRGVAAVIPEMQLGEFRATDVPAVIIPDGLPISLLGQSFLQRIGSIRVEGDAMILDD